MPPGTSLAKYLAQPFGLVVSLDFSVERSSAPPHELCSSVAATLGESRAGAVGDDASQLDGGVWTLAQGRRREFERHFCQTIGYF
jgi:hypothetical protein